MVVTLLGRFLELVKEIRNTEQIRTTLRNPIIQTGISFKINLQETSTRIALKWWKTRKEVNMVLAVINVKRLSKRLQL